MKFGAIILSVLACAAIGVLVFTGGVFWDRTQPRDTQAPSADTRTEASRVNETPLATASTERVDPTKRIQGTASSETIFLSNPPLTASTEAADGTKGIGPQTFRKRNDTRKSFLPLSSLSCQNECAQFTQEKELRYCLDYCGLDRMEPGHRDCEKLTGIDQDACLKNDAIENGDIESCKLIRDGNIHDSCVNRVLEDFMEKNTGL